MHSIFVSSEGWGFVIIRLKLVEYPMRTKRENFEKFPYSDTVSTDNPSIDPLLTHYCPRGKL
jgi:hypothetical protein